MNMGKIVVVVGETDGYRLRRLDWEEVKCSLQGFGKCMRYPKADVT